MKTSKIHPPPSKGLRRTGSRQGEGNGNGTPSNESWPSLRNEFGFWELAWNGQEAVLRCEPGTAYVGWLLANRPTEPIQALELAAMISGEACPCFARDEVFHPDGAAATCYWLRRQKELEALVDSEDELDPVKEEALRELEAVYAWQKSHPAGIAQDVEAAARAVTPAIEGFHRNLAGALDLRGRPHLLLRAFARWLHEHLLIPSRRCREARGCFLLALEGQDSVQYSVFSIQTRKAAARAVPKNETSARRAATEY